MILLATIGITLIIVTSSIFQPLRNVIESISGFFHTLITCPLCTGFWVGVFFEYHNVHIHYIECANMLLTYIMSGAIIGLLSYATHLFLEMLFFSTELGKKELMLQIYEEMQQVADQESIT